MDIIIHGWEMPDSCYECPFCDMATFGETYCCITGEELRFDEDGKQRKDFHYTEERSPECPLEHYDNR